MTTDHVSDHMSHFQCMQQMFFFRQNRMCLASLHVLLTIIVRQISYPGETHTHTNTHTHTRTRTRTRTLDTRDNREHFLLPCKRTVKFFFRTFFVLA